MSRQGAGGGKGGGGGKLTRKKFCTQGEEFFDFLKVLGYQPPKHQTYQHYEHLFQDEKTSTLAKKLMASLKPDNCLSLEESRSFEKAKEDGLVLYGRDLEEAVARRRAIDLMYSQQIEKIREKKEKLKEKVDSAEGELQRLTSLQDVFMSEFSRSQSKHQRIEHRLTILGRWISEYKTEIDIDMKLLSQKMEELENKIVELKKGLILDSSDPQYLCQLDVASILEKEECLVLLIQGMIAKHGAELIMKDAGYAVEGDPWNEANIKKIFGQFETDFERLKHCIIFEKVNQIQAEIALAGYTGSLKSFQDCYNKAREVQSMGYDARAKHQMDTRDKTNDIITALDKESKELMNLVREVTLHTFTQQFSSIVDINARAKKKVHEFFAVTMTTLKAQKIRMSLIRNLVKSEAKIYGKVMTNIEENIQACEAYNKKLAQISQSISGFTEEGKVLSDLLGLCGIFNTAELMMSVPRATLAVQKCLTELDEAYWNTVDQARVKVENSKKQILKQSEVVKKLARLEPEKDSVKMKLDEDEGALKEKKMELQRLQQMRPAQAHEREQERKELNEKMRLLLSSEE